MTVTLSLSEVRNALRCPRIFALGRQQRRAVGFPVAASSLGAAFQRIVSAFAAAVSGRVPQLMQLEADAEEASVARSFAALLLDEAAGEIERNPRYASMPAEVDDLAEALRALARHLAHEVKAVGGPPAAALARMLETMEREVEYTLELGGGDSVVLTGRLDALHAQGSDTLGLVEYKLASESSDALDRPQVALYRQLLRESRSFGATEPVVLRFQPGLTVVRLAAEEAEPLLQERILPLLHEMVAWAREGARVPGPTQAELCPSCPVRAACVVSYPAYLASRDQPPANAARPLPDWKGESLLSGAASKPTPSRVDDRPGFEEAEELRAAVERIYRAEGIAAGVGEAKVGPRIVSLDVRAKRGPARYVDRSAEHVVHRLEAELGTRASYVRSGGLRRFEVARRTPRAVLLASVLDRAEAYLRGKPGRFVLGEDIDGAVLDGDLSEPGSCHLLIAGVRGSGKSVLLRTLIASLAHYHEPDAIRFTLVDPTQRTFAPFRSSLSAHLAHPLCFELGETINILEGLVNELEERYRAFEEAGVEDLDGYNERPGVVQPIARHVLVIDEFAELVATKPLRGWFLSAVQRLCAKARAAGIHLVLATEQPDALTLPGVLRTSLVGRIALKLPDADASRLVIGQFGAERLLGRGDLYADFGAGATRAQAAMVSGG